MEDEMDLAVLSAPALSQQLPAIPKGRILSVEEQDMWANYDIFHDDFDAGLDHSTKAINERKRLEREANAFDLWHSADFIPETDPNDGELLLDALEQDDILTDLLRNARKSSRATSALGLLLNKFNQISKHLTQPMPLKKRSEATHLISPRLTILGIHTNPRR